MNRLRFLRNEKGESLEKIAKFLNVTIQTVSNYENEKRDMTPDTILKLAEYFNVSTDYLLCKSEYRSSYTTKNNNNKNYTIISVFGTIPAGIPMECIEDIIDTEEISNDMIKSDKEYFGLKIKGDSMFPEYLDGDTIILEKCDDCESGQDCVVMVNGNDGTFKRVFKNESGIILQPLNSKYSPMIYTNEQIEKLPVKVLGKVVELRRKK